MVADGVNLLLNITDSAVSVQSVNSPSCIRFITWVAMRSAKSEDFFHEFELIAVSWFGDNRSVSAIMCCVLSASDEC